MSWRREFQAGALALGTLVVIGVTGATFGVPWTSTSVRVSDASGTGAGVTEVVNEAGQDSTLAYWTTKRMWATAQVETQAAPASSVPKRTPRAVKFGGSPTTGALFFTTGGKAHFCSASVVHSTAGDLVLTAAHCVYSKGSGFAKNVEYVPQYHDGKEPYGVWPVRAIMVAHGWQRSLDPDLDFAFLTVGAANGPSIQKRTGYLAIGFNRPYNEKIEVVGHNDTDIDPVRCATKSFKFSATQMEFYCHGFWTGTSGGPWISYYNSKTGAGTVFGVIGGYEAGGNFEWASYSSYFGSAARTLYQQAERQSTPAPKPTPTPTPTPTHKPSPTASAASTASSSPAASTSPSATSPSSSPSASTSTSPSASTSPAASSSPAASTSSSDSSSPAASTPSTASTSPSPAALASTGSTTPT